MAGRRPTAYGDAPMSHRQGENLGVASQRAPAMLPQVSKIAENGVPGLIWEIYGSAVRRSPAKDAARTCRPVCPRKIAEISAQPDVKERIGDRLEQRLSHGRQSSVPGSARPRNGSARSSRTTASSKLMSRGQVIIHWPAESRDCSQA